MKNRWLALAAALGLCIGSTSCARLPQQMEDNGKNSGVASGDTTDTTESHPEAEIPAEEDLFTARDYRTTYEDAVQISLTDGASAGDGVQISGNTVTITEAGTYLFSGSLHDGQLVVRVAEDEKVHLVLDGVSVENAGGAALYVASGDKVFLTTVAGTTNTLSSLGECTQADDSAVDGAVFSRADLTLNGEGTLRVLCEDGHGIVTKDDLKITSGTYEIDAGKQGLSGKDSIRIAGGTISIVSGTDGMRSRNTESADRGYVYIGGGSLQIVSGGDGIYASGTIQITGGSFEITAGGGSDYGRSHQDGGWFSSFRNQTDVPSMKGVKSDTCIALDGGTLTLNCADDGFHAGDTITVSGGVCQIRTGDDGFHADNALYIRGGSITVTESYEGLEALVIEIADGDITLTASDDGINAGGGTDQSGMGGMFGRDPFAATEGASLTIGGGNVCVYADGDGLDSNGSLTVSGGSVFVHGPTGSGDGALDYDSTATVTGGIVVAFGSSGMAENFDSSSTQGSILYTFSSTQPAGTIVTLWDSEGQELVSCASEKRFQTVVISVPGITSDGVYTLTAGEQSYTISMNGIVYGNSHGMGGMHNRPGGKPR